MSPDRRTASTSQLLAPPAEPFVLTPNEAARALRVSRSKLYQLARAGAIPSVRIGSSLRIPRRALEALVDCGATNSTPNGRGLADPSTAMVIRADE